MSSRIPGVKEVVAGPMVWCLTRFTTVAVMHPGAGVANQNLAVAIPCVLLKQGCLV